MSTRANKSEVTNQILLGLTELHRLSKRDEPLSITGILTSHGLSYSRAKSVKEKLIERNIISVKSVNSKKSIVRWHPNKATPNPEMAASMNVRTYTRKKTETNPELEKFTAKQLVEELRTRGYIVQAYRTVEEVITHKEEL